MLTLLVGVAALIYQLIAQTPVLDAGVWAFQAAISVFLAWAITRELDPDHPTSAMLAAALATALIWWTGPANLFILAWILAALRASIGTVGLPLTWLDISFITIAGGWFMYSHDYVFGLLIIIALGREVRLGKKTKLFKYFVYAISFVIFGLLIWNIFLQGSKSIASNDEFDLYWTILWIISALLFYLRPLSSLIILFRNRRNPEQITMNTTEDVSDKPLNFQDYSNAIIIVSVFGMYFAMRSISFQLMPLWMAFLAIGLFNIPRAFMRETLPTNKVFIRLFWITLALFVLGGIVVSIYNAFKGTFW